MEKKINKMFIIHIDRFTPGKFYRIGHYTIYEYDVKGQSEHMRNITNKVAKDGDFYLDRRGSIRIKQGGLDGRRRLEDWLYKHYGYEGIRVFILGDR